MIIIVLILSFILGSLPFGYYLVLMFYKKNLLQTGSGKIGMTNVIRTTNIPLGILVLICDVGKGILAVLLAQALVGSSLATVLAAVTVNIGHNWSIFLRFQGGRGVLTAAGSMLMMVPLATIIGGIIGLTVMAITKYGSLGSFVAITSAFIVVIISTTLGNYDPIYLGYAIFKFCFLVYRHKDNIVRLAKGKEKKLGSRTSNL
jgi:glycerol-3-phosphate acyltransferase PlsY|tara:strand:+ start:3798 stop:4406 length:609 start_codon:yes stop_codon:yes gene_type:complete